MRAGLETSSNGMWDSYGRGSKGIMWALIFFYRMFSRTVAQQPCSLEALHLYQECVANNPCVCSNCDYDPTDNYPVNILVEPQDCQDLNDFFCSLANCCSPCANISKIFYTCGYEYINAQYLSNSTCSFTCGNTFSDVNGTCPSPSPTSVCDDASSSHRVCAFSRGCQTKCDLIAMDHIENLYKSNSSCGEVNTLLCPWQHCCNECDISPLQQCVASEIVGVDPCTLDCTTTSPSIAPSNVVVPSSSPVVIVETTSQAKRVDWSWVNMITQVTLATFFYWVGDEVTG